MGAFWALCLVSEPVQKLLVLESTCSGQCLSAVLAGFSCQLLLLRAMHLLGDMLITSHSACGWAWEVDACSHGLSNFRLAYFDDIVD